MPRTKKTGKKTYRKKRTTRKRNNHSGLTLFPRRSFPFPDKKMCKFAFCDTGVLYAGANARYGEQKVYQLNAPNDPDIQGAYERLSYAWRTIAKIYTYFKVLSVDVILTFVDPTIDGMITGTQVGIATDSLTGNYPKICEMRPRTICKPINNTGNQQVVHKFHFDIAKLAQITRLMYNSSSDANWCGTIGNGFTGDLTPAKSVYLWIAASHIDLGDSGGTLKYKLDITYNTLCYELITQENIET